MKWVRPQKLDIFSFLLVIPFVVMALNLIMFEDRVWKEREIWWVSFPLTTMLSFISFMIHVQYDHWVESRFPLLEQSSKRIALRSMVHVFVMTPSVILELLFFDFFNILSYEIQLSHVYMVLLVGLCVNIIIESLNEADFIFQKYRESRLEKANIESISISQEFDSLKNQVNPHFLFNCFNTLSSLISIDKVRAEKFLNEMSKVYRYLLKNNQESMSTVESEVRFIDSYFKLMETRYGDAVKWNIQIDKQYEHYVLPSLSLQLLVENVVKHNALSKEKPVTIEIFTSAGSRLVVSNNVQPRTVKALSNGVGLQNIRAKYVLLKQKGFQIVEDQKNFTVILPLIWHNDPSKLVV